MRILEEALLDKGYAYVKNLESQYNIAIAEIDKQIAAWFQRFAKNNGISLAEAKKLLNSNELEEFRWTVAEYIRHGEENALSGEWTKQLENASSRVHISRLDSLKIQLRQEAEALHGSQLQATESLLGEIYREGYSHTAFEVQKGIGFAWSFVGVDSTRLEKVLARPWTADGQTFRDRVWTNKDALVNSVNTQITQMIMRGEAPDKAIKNIAHQFNVSKKKAGRLVMTESAAFASFSQKDCYDDLGVEKYEIVETPDNETCEVCGELDGKVFNMSDFQVGTTAPPFHPWCRGFTAPWYEDMQNIGARAARDAVTGESYELPAGTTYKQWKEMQDAKYGAGTVDKMRKRSYNENIDKKQFDTYKALLGSNAPKTFKDFQCIKYGDDWKPFKAYSRAIKAGELTPLADFKLYKTTSSQIDKVLVGKTTYNGLLVSAKSDHFIARTIGSVEQKRNGVSVETSLNTLLYPTKVDPVRQNKNGTSQRFIGDGAAVTINPKTGQLIQVNPLKHKK